jgi:hypothetical protein
VRGILARAVHHHVGTGQDRLGVGGLDCHRIRLHQRVGVHRPEPHRGVLGLAVDHREAPHARGGQVSCRGGADRSHADHRGGRRREPPERALAEARHGELERVARVLLLAGGHGAKNGVET